MQTAVPSSSAVCRGGGGHWSDSGTHAGGDADHYDDSAAAASDVFRDFTWYSAMLLSHLFALEYAQVARDAAAEEARRSAASAHSPQLLMRAAMAAANTPTTTAATTQNLFAAAPNVSAAQDDHVSRLRNSNNNGAEDGSQPAAAATAAAQTAMEVAEEILPLPHLTAQHRPHILLGFTTSGAASGHANRSEENVWNDPSTRWTAPARLKDANAGAAVSADRNGSKTAALLAAFDAFYFPSELFSSPANAPGALATAAKTTTSASRTAPSGAVGSDAAPLTTDDADGDGGVNRMNLTAAAAGGGGGAPAGASRVTPEALREAFHTLLQLGQRCAAFSLTFHGIIGAAATTEDGAGDGTATVMVTSRSGDNIVLSSEDELRSGSGAGTTGAAPLTVDNAGMQQAASASLQFMLQLACSCPCAPLSYAAQLCIAHALAVQPTPRSAAGWAARQQLLRFLPTLQPPSRTLATDAAAATAAGGNGGGGGGVHHHSSTTTGTAPGTAAAAPSTTTSSGPSMSAAGANTSNRVPATQYVRAEDQLLWFDEAGAVHVTTAQRWWEGQPPPPSRSSRGGSFCAYCGPLPATTALPTVQRLLMEENQYAGPNGSAAAVLLSILEAVSTEVTLNARLIPGSSSSSSRVHTSLRRRRGVHSGGGGVHTPASLNGGQRTAAAGLMRAASPTLSNASLDVEGGGVRGGSPTLPRPSSVGSQSSSNPHSTSSTAVARTHATAASSRLSKAAKRRRALLFALAQSHLLPPTAQLVTTKTLLYGVFTDGGECPSYYTLLSLYPEVLRAHHASLHYVLFEEGPLSVDVRLMVATMAASRHRCEYLVSRFSALLLRYAEEAMFEDGHDDDGDDNDVFSELPEDDDPGYRSGGGGRHYDAYRFGREDEVGGYHGPRQPRQQRQKQQLPCRGQARQRWITHGPPSRLRAVQHFIAIAAHTPWTLNEDDIRGVLANGWTIPEVFQLAAIVAQVVPLCSFVMGLFVPAEPWTMTLLPLEVVTRLGHRAVAEETSAGGGGGMVSSGSSGTLSVLRRVSNMPSDAMTGACPGPATPHQAATSRSLLGAAISSGSDTVLISGGSGTVGSPPGSTTGTNSNVAGVADVYRRYAGEDAIVSEQRIKGSNATANPHTLWRSQFTWNEVGATSMEQYYPGAATLMSEEIECFFDVVRQLTKADCVGLMSPDYAPSYAFRSLQLYVQNLLGFMVEDYPYNDINKVLRRPAKWFAQVLTMRPETLTRSAVVRWYVPTTPPIGKSTDLNAESSLVTHQLKREIELLSVVDSAQGGHRGGIESASAHPDLVDSPPPTPAEAARDAAEAEALQTALTLQDERVLLLIALATMEARKEGLLHILLRPVCSVLSNM
ncbi:hypothetical protein ABB37_06146 [Leptomonas pyrrhocoris]|uniref:Uncharacterized protein n=1 Tax=Leptomonas pyrrhocoris TaxID=157538 RepID=A0A0M9FY86_LEPPY|nr:hypothetical protein ABB37_06146 [Leptomonas pyrrhocoris]KPA78545.1 hypothetical protein ABB37_06146 [Leptomonas pyrrhocoris]|eukprot:XP_015656984.1 hypothetical protein ABB37_06146 [Leptomonas pyrrhocoris]